MIRAIAGVVVFASAAAAFADVDVAVGNGVKVAGTFDPGSETETFRFDAPAGAALTVDVKGRKRKGGPPAPPARIALFDPAHGQVGAGETTTSSSGARLSGFALPGSGEYRVVVSSEGQAAGDYQLLVSWKVAKKLAFDGTAGAAPATFTISLQAGAVATLTASAPSGSVARPWVSQVEGGAFSQGFAQPAPSLKHKVTTAAVPFTGDYVVSVADQGGQGGGTVHLAVAVKAPKPVKKTIAIGAALLAKAGGAGSFVRGALIGPDGGGLDVGDAGTPIDGASVAVPPGALSVPTPIVIGTGSPIPGTGGRSAAGPTILLGPEGTAFASDVTITIPFDPALLAGGDTDALTVLTRDAKGNVSPVPKPYTIDAVTGTVSFPSSHFSSYRVFGPARAPAADLDGDGIDDLVVTAPLDASGRGAVFVFRGRADVAALDGATTADADFAFTGVNATVGFTPGDLFGAAAATGDVDGDGVADLVVGATRADSGRGAVYVFLGGPGFASRSSAAADVTLSAGASDERFGGTLVVADVDRDGVADIVVGAPLAGTLGVFTGAVYVFRGGPSFANAAAGDAGVASVAGAVDFGLFGGAIAVGDVTGDGKPDLAVGSDELASQNAGAVYVFPDAATVAHGRTVGQIGFSITGGAVGDAFGTSVAIGDVDRDGTADLVVGAPLVDGGLYGQYPDMGRVFVFAGGPSLAATSAEAADRFLDAPGDPTGANGGSSLVVANLVGDAAADVLLAAPGASFGSLTKDGAAFLTRGGAAVGGAYDARPGAEDGEHRGVLLVPADVDGDGYLDAVVASPDAGGGAGIVHVYRGPGITGAAFTVSGVGAQRLGARDIALDVPAKR